jgi:hypothetical protein
MFRASSPITATTLFTLVTLGTLAIGCDSPSEKQANERSEAKKEVADAGKDAKKEIAEAKKDLNEAQVEYGEKVGEAQKEIADKVVEGSKEVTAADKEAAKANAADRYTRFEILKDETEAAFATRAEGALATLKTDLDAARKRSTASGAAKDLTNDVGEASTAIDEATKHLNDLRAKKGKFFDEGRIGVGTKINEAQRELGEVYVALADAKM